MKALDFFAGSGLVRLGLEPHFQTVWANDICPKKAAVYNANTRRPVCVASIADVRGGDLPDADLAWASFPCQDLSVAGRRRGIGKGTRSGLFWEWVRVIDEMGARRPPVLAVENVVGFLTGGGGGYFRRAYHALRDRGYLAGALVIDARLFLPHSRPRAVLVAVRSDMYAGGLARSLPGPFHTEAVVRAAGAVQDPAGWVWWSVPEPPVSALRFRDVCERGAPCESADRTAARLALLSAAGRQKLREQIESGGFAAGTGFLRARPAGCGRRRQRLEIRFDGVAGCLRTPGGGSRQLVLLVDRGEVRTRLMTVRECARLMGCAGTVQDSRHPRRRVPRNGRCGRRARRPMAWRAPAAPSGPPGVRARGSGGRGWKMTTTGKERPGPPYYYTGLSMRDVRGFDGEHELNLADGGGAPAPWTVIVGEGGSGKTTLLRHLARMRPRFNLPPDDADGPGGPPAALPVEPELAVEQDNDALAAVACDGKAARLEARLSGGAELGQTPRGLLTTLYCAGQKGGRLTDAIVGNGGGAEPAVGAEAPLVLGYGAGRYPAPPDADVEAGPVASLFADAPGLPDAAERLRWLDYAALSGSLAAARQLDGLKAVIGEAVPGVSGSENVRIGTARDAGRIYVGDVPLDRMGLGCRTMFAWVTDIAWRLLEHCPDSLHVFEEPAVVIVDEIDTYLPPSGLSGLCVSLTAHFPRVQFVASARRLPAEGGNRLHDTTGIVWRPDPMRMRARSASGRQE